MLTYNTQRKKLALPEYGRNIQKMVDHCLTLADKDERTRCACTIVDTMETLFPPEGDFEEYRRKLWDHLAIMSNFELDIDWPFEVIRPDSLEEKPQPMQHAANDIKYKQYGHNLEMMVQQASQMEPSEDRDALALLLAHQMKKQLLAINPDNADDMRIFNDLMQMSHGVLDLRDSGYQLLEYKVLPTPKKKKKK